MQSAGPLLGSSGRAPRLAGRRAAQNACLRSLPACPAVRQARLDGAGAAAAPPCVAELLAQRWAVPAPALQSAVARCPELLSAEEAATRRVAPIVDILQREGFSGSEALSKLLLKCPQVGCRLAGWRGGQARAKGREATAPSPLEAPTIRAAAALEPQQRPSNGAVSNAAAPHRPCAAAALTRPGRRNCAPFPPMQVVTYCPSRAEESLAFLSENLGLSPQQRAEVVRRFPQVRERGPLGFRAPGGCELAPGSRAWG
jgi:hypothetical protein